MTAGMGTRATVIRPRISIAALLAGMVPIAVGLAALADPTAFWEGTVFVLTLLALFTGVVGICYRRGAGRAFWVGFSLFGWGFFVLAFDLSFGFGSAGLMQNGPIWTPGAEAENEKPVAALVKTLVDILQMNRRSFPRSVGEKIEVQWGSPESYYPCSVLEIKDNQYRISYDGDLQGRWDEWVGRARIKSANGDRCYRIAELLIALLFGIVGAMIALWFHATLKASEPVTSA